MMLPVSCVSLSLCVIAIVCCACVYNYYYCWCVIIIPFKVIDEIFEYHGCFGNDHSGVCGELVLGCIDVLCCLLFCCSDWRCIPIVEWMLWGYYVVIK